VSGTITSASDTLDLVFSPTVIVIGTETYTLQTTYELVAPNTNRGVTTIQAFLTSANTIIPEPRWLVLSGCVVLVAAVLFRKRKA
jgi:hypothetical protein